MSSEVHTVGDGGLSQVTHEGLTLVSNSETAEEIRENLEAEPKPLDGEPEDPKEAEKKKLTKAASELGKKGAEAAAKARAEKDDLEEEPEEKAEKKVEAKDEGKKDEEEKPANPRKDARARVMEATRAAAEARKAREAAEARAEELEARIARLEAERAGGGARGVEAPGKAVTGQGGAGKPTPDKFDTYEEFAEALADWKIEERIKKLTHEAEIQKEATRFADRIGQTVKAFNERFMKAAEADPDLMQRVKPDLLNLKPTFTLPPRSPVTADNDIAQAIVESEHPEALLVYLSEHEEEYERIRRLRDTHQVNRAIGALEAKFERAAPQPAVVAETVSRAKPPVRPIPGSPQVNDELSDDMDFDEYVRLANARERRRR